jgi:hypothetical protein
MTAMSSPTADWYMRAATRDLVGHSALHVEWAAGVAADADVLALLDRLPRERRQPSLIFSVATWLGAGATDYPAFRTWLVENWPAVEATARERRTQTNEVGRCAPLVAALARIPGPLACSRSAPRRACVRSPNGTRTDSASGRCSAPATR